MKININIFINFCSYLASNILGASRNVSIREYMDVRTILPIRDDSPSGDCACEGMDAETITGFLCGWTDTDTRMQR